MKVIIVSMWVVLTGVVAWSAWAGDFRMPDQHMVRSTRPGQFAPATTGTSVLLGNGTGGFSLLAGNTLSPHNFGTQLSAAGVLIGAQPMFTDISGVATSAQLPSILPAMAANAAMTTYGGL